MSTPAIQTLTWFVGLGLAAVTGLLGAVTITMAWWKGRKHDRVSETLDQLQEQLLERLFETDPDWNAWIAELSGVERRQLQLLTDQYLRRLRGTEFERLYELAEALGLPAQAKRDLDSGRGRFRALTWLALLQEPVTLERLKRCCTGTQRERAGAARLLFESNHADAPELGTNLLIGDGHQPLSAFGLDTLYRLNNGTETPILARVAEQGPELDTRLLVQVLMVLRFCSVSEPPERLALLGDLFDHETPQVRAATVGVIERHGWREPFQSRIDIDELLADPAPTVRYDVYHLLASWGSEESAALLRDALNAADDHELLAVMRAISIHPRASLPEPTGRLEQFVQWVKADEAVARRKEPKWGVGAAWG